MVVLCYFMDQLFPENSLTVSGSKNIVKPSSLNEKPSFTEASGESLDYSITKKTIKTSVNAQLKI